MNEEERQRMMEFLLKQQADFSADLQQLEAQQATFSQALQRIGDSVLALTTILGEAIKHQSGFNEQLVESSRRTDDRLNAFIAVLEKHIINGGQL